MPFPKFQKYVKPNCTVYDNYTPNGQQVNPLTGGLVLTTEIEPGGFYLTAHIEFTNKSVLLSPKNGFKSQGIRLQGRVYYTSPDDDLVPTWYQYGSKYHCIITFNDKELKGYWYALQQLEAMMVTEAKYFGFPLLGDFVLIP